MPQSPMTAAPVWRRSSRCEMGNCLEISATAAKVFVRSSNDPDVVLTLDHLQWSDLVAAVREGRFAS